MKFSVLLLFSLIIIIRNSSPLDEDNCSFKSYCADVSEFNSVLPSTNLTCFKTPFCKITGRESTCNGFYHSNQHLVTVEKIDIQQMNKSSWVQLTLSSSYLWDMNEKENHTALVVRVSLNDDSTCYNFIIPFLFIKDHIVLPCIQILATYNRSLRFEIFISYKNFAKNSEELISMKAREYSLKNLSSSGKLKLNDIKLQYSFQKNGLHLYTNLKCFFFYNISIHESLPHKICNENRNAICHMNSTMRKHHLTMPCDTLYIKPCQMYCIRVVFHQFKSCSSLYPKNLIEITFIKNAANYRNDSIQPVCKLWNADVHVTNDSRASLTNIIQFFPEPEFRQCFNFYEVYLYRLRKPKCDPRLGTQIRKYHVTELKNESGLVKFSNLTSGYYCALIVPLRGHKRYKAWSVHSEVFEVHALKTKSNLVIGPENFPAEVIIAALLIFCICVLGLLFCRIQKRKSKQSYIVDVKYPKEIFPLIFNPIEVYIFHFWTTIIIENVRLLKEFLEIHAGFKVTTMQQILNKARINKTDWTKDVFDYKCAKYATGVLRGDGDSNKRFIFINSEQSINRKEDETFLFALKTISTNKGQRKDCCHMFVVSFEDEPRGWNITKKLVPGIRYSIPKELVDLCVIMGFALTKKEDLDNSLKNHPLQHINRSA